MKRTILALVLLASVSAQAAFNKKRDCYSKDLAGKPRLTDGWVGLGCFQMPDVGFKVIFR